VRIHWVFLVTWLAATGAFAQELSWADLVRRPELWPSQCTMKTAIKFEGGASVQPGQKVDVLEIKGNEVDLKTTDGRVNFAAEPDETDVLTVARVAYAKLTPKQRELTYPSLAQRKELWPSRVTVTRSFDLAPGKTIHSGDQLVLNEVQPGKLIVASEKFNARFAVAPQATDLMAQARTIVETKDGVSDRFVEDQRRAAEAKRMEEKKQLEGRVVTELEGKLINSVTGQPEPLDQSALPRYVVFLRGSTTCPITRGFLPKVVKYYQETKPKHPEFEMVYLTVDSVDDTEKFAKEFGFSWRTVTYENTTMPSVNPYINGKLPQLIVMDRNGRVLANGFQSTAPGALQQLDALLKQPAAQN